MERDSLDLHGMDEHEPISLYKYSHLRNKNPNYYSFSSSKGILKAPPLSLYHSAPFSPPQPPLLPLPSSLPRRTSSCPTTRKHQKKSTKASTSNNHYTISKRDDKKIHPKRSSETVTVTPAGKIGAETAALPRNTARVARLDDSVIRDRVDMLLSSVVLAISPPPPSSLPLPTFSLRPKLSCNAAAAGIDAGATDDLRRLLRLQ